MKIFDSVTSLHLSSIVDRKGRRIATHLVEKSGDSMQREGKRRPQHIPQPSNSNLDDEQGSNGDTTNSTTTSGLDITV